MLVAAAQDRMGYVPFLDLDNGNYDKILASMWDAYAEVDPA